MKLKLELVLFIFLLNNSFCISQTYYDAIKKNKVKSVKNYNTDLSGNKLDYVEDSLYFMKEYNSNGYPIFEEKLIKYSDGFELGVPFDNYWVYNDDKLLIEQFSISKDHYSEGINNEKNFTKGGDTNFHYTYEYKNGLKSKESYIVHQDDGTTYPLVTWYEYVSPQIYTTTFGDSQSFFSTRFTFTDTIDLEVQLNTSINSKTKRKILTEKIISTTRIKNSLKSYEIDSLILIFPKFELSGFSVETKEKSKGTSKTIDSKKTTLVNLKNQICYKVIWDENARIFHAEKFIYSESGLLDKVITYSFIGNYRYIIDTFEYDFY
jgi:hypothetical protein